MSKKTTASLVALVIAASVLFFSAMPADAADNVPSEQLNSVIERIAHKLQLQPSEVRAVFEEVHKEKQSLWLSRFEKRLAEAVSRGTITESQKLDLLNKYKELQQKWNDSRDELMNMSREERRSALQKEQNELFDWAEQKGISKETLRKIGFGPHSKSWIRGFKAGYWAGNN